MGSSIADLQQRFKWPRSEKVLPPEQVETKVPSSRQPLGTAIQIGNHENRKHSHFQERITSMEIASIVLDTLGSIFKVIGDVIANAK